MTTTRTPGADLSRLRLGTAPDSWGVWFPDDPHQVPWQRFLDEVVEGATAGSSSVPTATCPPTPGSCRTSWAGAGSSSPAGRSSPGCTAAQRPTSRRSRTAAPRPACSAPSGARYLVLLPEQYTDMHSGSALEPGELEPAQWKDLVTGMSRLGKVLQEESGIQLVFHPHADSHVDTQPRVERLLQDTDPGTVSLCLDTGHISYCGGDNLEIIRAFPDRIGYVHLKQVDPEVVRRVREESLSFADAVRLGAMVEPPTGIPAMEPLLEELGRLDADLFAIVEQDLYPCEPDSPCRWRRAPAPTSTAAGSVPRPDVDDVTPSGRPGAPPSPRQKEGIMKPSLSRKRPTMLVATTAVLAAGLAACSSGGAPRTSSGDSGAAGGGGNSGYTFAMITHETPGDTFWDRIKAGAQQASKDTGSTLKYSADPDAPSRQSSSRTPSTPRSTASPPPWSPRTHSSRPSRRPIDAGIPVDTFNSGINFFQQAGSLTHFASDERLGGQAVGKRAAAAGATKILCTIQQAGSVALEDRCAGVKDSFPNTVNMQVNGADDSAVTSAIQAKLSEDKSINWIVTLGAPQALDAIKAKQGAGSTAKIGTFDTNPDAAQAVQDGKIQFFVDQQPYLQGYMAITQLYLFKKNGNILGGGKAVLTGPSFVDKSNIAQILPFVKRNTR